MNEVFISHSSKDADAAQTICAAIEARGLRCWIAARDVGPGQNYQSSIVSAISEASAMVLVFSDHCNHSDEIMRELALAGQKRLLVIPVRIEDVMPVGAFQYELATRQWIDVFKDWEEAIGKIVITLQAIHPVQRAGVYQAPAARASPGSGKAFPMAWAVSAGAAVVVAAGLYFGLRGPAPLNFPEAGPETTESRVTQFVIHVQLGAGSPVRRDWNRVTADRWVEVYPNGSRDTTDVVRRMILGGCPGTVVQNQVNKGNFAFIPDRGCPEGMYFRISHGGGGWGIASEMSEVK